MMPITDNDLALFRERAKTELESTGDIGRIAWDYVVDELCKEVARLRSVSKESGDCAKLREAISALRTALKEIRNDVLDMVMNHKSEDPDSYAHGLCLSIGGACDMALNSTKEFEEGGNNEH